MFQNEAAEEQPSTSRGTRGGRGGGAGGKKALDAALQDLDIGGKGGSKGRSVSKGRHK